MRKLAKLLLIYVDFVFYNSLNFIYLTVLNIYIQFLFFKIKINIINVIFISIIWSKIVFVTCLLSLKLKRNRHAYYKIE